MKKIALFLMLAVSAAAVFAQPHKEKSLSEFCLSPKLEQVLPQPLVFAPVPKYGDPFWTDSIPAEMRADFVRSAEKLRGTKWESINLDLFAQFRTTGNRVNYEKFIFGKREKLATLVMAEVLEGKGRFMPDIINGVQSLCEETWWGIPAHYPDAVPTPQKQPLDLFNAESGALAAWTAYMLGDEIKKFSPILYDRLLADIKRRIIDPGLDTREWWRGASMNWNPWICSNWLFCVLVAEPDRDRQLQAVREIAESLDAFIDKYPEDGGCDEGASYWDRAAGSLLDCLLLLDLATDGQLSLADDDKVHAMASYICKMNVDNTHFVNFADAAPRIGIRPEWFAGAYLIGDKELMSLTAQAAAKRNYAQRPGAIFRSDNFPALGREFLTLRIFDRLLGASERAVLPFDAWFPRIEVLTARSKPDSAEGLFLAAKGGHNDESHNHNDVGSFIVYADGEPLLIDPGSCTYTASSFNGDRYKMWHTQSGYHNLPKINGVDQKQGASYKASGVKAEIGKKKAKFTADIAGAYAEHADVNKWLRTIELQRSKKIVVTEDYELARWISPSKLIFMAVAKPEITDNSVIFNIKGSKYALEFDPAQLKADCETMDIDDARMRGNWGSTLYRITLTILPRTTAGRIAYTIKKL